MAESAWEWALRNSEGLEYFRFWVFSEVLVGGHEVAIWLTPGPQRNIRAARSSRVAMDAACFGKRITASAAQLADVEGLSVDFQGQEENGIHGRFRSYRADGPQGAVKT